jgi:large subunit ribosomal protein L9
MAQAILLQDVEDLGQRGDPVDVSPGYLRNYLVPRKLAQPATAGALEEAQRRRVVAEKAERARAEREAQAAGLLSKTVLTIYQRAGEDGKLFGSVGPKEIVDAIREARDLRIDRRKVRLEQPIREVGTFMVEIELADGATAAVKTIVAEEK